jgi:PST family polysaccharide transporter
MALNGFGYWALVFQIISSNILRFLFCLLLSKWFPSPVFLLKPVYESLKYAFHVLGFNSINYWARNADNFLIGKFIGSVGLGYYNQAYKLMRMPQNLLTGVLNSVLHPVFANLQDNLEQLRKGYYRILKLMITISLPLGIFMIILGPEIIRVIWGNKWEQSIPIFQILACVSCVQPAIATTGPILLASNRSKIYFNMGILTTFIYVSGFVVGVSFGIEGVAISYLITNAVVAPIVLYVTYSVVLSGCFFEVISLWFKPLVKSLILAIVLLSMKTYLTLSTDLARLLLSTLILLIYFIIEAINLKMLSLPMQIRKEKNNV